MENQQESSNYWNYIYKENNLPSVPSQFAAFTANELHKHESIIYDIGCGNGRDTIFFASLGKKVIGLDGSETVVDLNKLKTNKINNIDFLHCDFSSKQKQYPIILDKAIIYARFFIHAINEEAEENFLEYISHSLEHGQRVFFEFRTEKDEDILKIAEKHYRRYIRIDGFKERLEKAEFNIEYFVEGKGFAKYKEEDAYVCRIIARKK